jgi:chloramphenicol 3-O phosphotransferase
MTAEAAAPGQPGKVILVNGASSSGKSTLCRALQARLSEPFWHYSIDHFRDTGVLPDQRIASGEFSWADMRPAFFEGFHRCLPALALAGNNLLVEYVVEGKAWLSGLVRLLEPVDVFFVGLHCGIAELERREIHRGDRPLGDAARDYALVHAHCRYDIEVDSTHALEDNVRAIIKAWRVRAVPGAHRRMLQDEDPAVRPGDVAC